MWKGWKRVFKEDIINFQGLEGWIGVQREKWWKCIGVYSDGVILQFMMFVIFEVNDFVVLIVFIQLKLVCCIDLGM